MKTAMKTTNDGGEVNFSASFGNKFGRKLTFKVTNL